MVASSYYLPLNLIYFKLYLNHLLVTQVKIVNHKLLLEIRIHLNLFLILIFLFHFHQYFLCFLVIFLLFFYFLIFLEQYFLLQFVFFLLFLYP